MAEAPGLEEIKSLTEAGFNGTEIEAWKVDTRLNLQDAGFSVEETDEYFGQKEPDMKLTKARFEENILLKKAEKEASEKPANPDAPIEAPEVTEAQSFVEAIEAGFDISVSGLMLNKPDTVLPENANMFYRIASQVGTLAGDVPAMVAGAVAGAPLGAAAFGAAGSVIPGAGTVAGAALGSALGAGAGAMALPEGMRTVMMQHYEKGDIKSFSDFWERTSAVAINSLKSGAIGAATAGIGGAAGKALVGAAIPQIAKTSAQLTAEVATMTTLGAALEGHAPNPQDFIDGAIIVGGLRGVTVAASKIRNVYAKSGELPAQVTEKINTDANLKQQVLANNVETPSGGELGNVKKPSKPPENFETTKKLKEPNPDLSPEVNTILEKVDEKVEAQKKSLTASQVYTALVDKLDPINEATKALTANKENLSADANPYVLARVSVDAKAKAKHMFEKGVIDYDTKAITGESLKSTLEKVESVETLEAYLISKRVLEKSAQGIETGFDLEAARKVVSQNKSKYELAAKKVTEFSNGVLEYAQKSGVISKEQLEKIKAANKDYVPFKRIMDAADASGKGKRQGKAGSLKEMKGSERDIQSPILSVVENTIELIQMAEMNRPKAALVELANKMPEQELIRKVKTPVEEITVSKEEVARQLGISLEAAEAVTTFRGINKELSPNQFSVFKDGKRQVYETTPELAEAIKRLGGDVTATNILFKIANGITTVKKFGITFTPDFIVRNLFRDTITASTFSKSKGMNPLDIIGAMGDIWKKNDTYYEWLKSGGANGAFIEMGDRYVKNDIFKLQKETNFMNSARNLIQKPVDAMRLAAELSEQSVRLAEFKKVRQAGGSLTEGGYASREITIDFQRVGARISSFNSITAFMNVSIQGLDRSVRAFKEDPAAVATKSIAYITAPSILLWWANHDDPRYQEIPRWEKDLFWIIPTDDWKEVKPEEADGLPEYMVQTKGDKTFVNKGSIYRLPKPQELGILFGSLPERTLEAFFSDNPGAFKDFGETMINLVTPSFVPDALTPAIEQFFNKSFFTGREIVPHHLKDVLPEYQFVEYTSETAKTLGKMVATIDRQSEFASPLVLQNYIRSWGGSLGQYAVQMADKALTLAGVAPDNVDPTSTLSDIPFIKSFVVRFPQAGSNSVRDFYDNYDQSKKIFSTIAHLREEGDYEAIEKEIMLESNQDKLVKLDGIKEALSAQSKFIRLINKNPEITPDEKRQMIDGMYLMMTETAKNGNFLLENIRKNLGE